MKVKRQKQHRRAVRFYTVCHGFREPFKILCDGTFVHHLLENRITPADTALANTLGGAVKLFATRCVLAELRSLGDSYSDALNAARNLMTARCDHEKRKSAVECLTEVIGENNPDHFFVATQDAELRKKLQAIPSVPLIYALRNALLLERPSATQQQFAKNAEEKRSHLTDMEYNMLKVKKNRLADDEPVDSSHANHDHKRNEIATKDKAQFKRKRAKGPNPLSCKKKKIEQTADSALTKENGSDTSRSRKKKRPRKRKSKSKITTEATV